MNFVQLQYQPDLIVNLTNQPAVWEPIITGLTQIDRTNRLIHQQIKLYLSQVQSPDVDHLDELITNVIQQQSSLDQAILQQLVTLMAEKWQRYLHGERKTAPASPRPVKSVDAQSDVYSLFAGSIEQIIDWNLTDHVVKLVIDRQLKIARITIQLTTDRAVDPISIIKDQAVNCYYLIQPISSQAPRAAQSLSDVIRLLHEYSPDMIVCDDLLLAEQISNARRAVPILVYSQAGLRSTSFSQGESPIWREKTAADVTDLDPSVNEGYQLLRRYDINCIESVTPFRQLLQHN